MQHISEPTQRNFNPRLSREESNTANKIYDRWKNTTQLAAERLQIMGFEDGKVLVKVDLSSMDFNSLDKEKSKNALLEETLTHIERLVEELKVFEQVDVVLKELDVSHNEISGRSIFGSPLANEKERVEAVNKRMRILKDLSILDMSYTQASSRTMEFLKFVPNIQAVYFNNCENFKDLPPLKSLELPKKLQRISVIETPIKKISKLQQKFPTLQLMNHPEQEPQLDIRALKRPLPFEVHHEGLDSLLEFKGFQPNLPTAYRQLLEKEFLDILKQQNPNITRYIEEQIEQSEKSYNLLKKALLPIPGLNIKFDDDTFRMTFYHSEKEVNALLKSLGLAYLFTSLTLTREGLTMRQGSIFTVSENSMKQMDAREKTLISSCIKFYQTRAVEHRAIKKQTPHADKAILNAIKENQGCCIGELHQDPASKRILIKNMQAFKEQGVKTLYLEHLFYDSLQAQLDLYFQSSADELPPLLKLTLKELDTGFRLPAGDNFTDLVIAAKQAGIRVVGIDTSLSYLIGTSDKMGVTEEGAEERYMAMNAVAVKIIEKEQKMHGGKFVALMGNAHIAECEGVAGVAELLHVPSLFVESSTKNNVAYDTTLGGQHYSATISLKT